MRARTANIQKAPGMSMPGAFRTDEMAATFADRQATTILRGSSGVDSERGTSSAYRK